MSTVDHRTHAKLRDSRWIAYCDGCGWILGGLLTQGAALARGENHQVEELEREMLADLEVNDRAGVR